MAHKKKIKKTASARKKKRAPAPPIDIGEFPKRRKAKPIKSEKGKLKALADLKKVRAKIDKMNKRDQKRFHAQDRLFKQSQTLREQLDID